MLLRFVKIISVCCLKSLSFLSLNTSTYLLQVWSVTVAYDTLNHTHTHIHTRQDSSGRGISPTQRTETDNTQHTEKTFFSQCGIRTRSPSKRGARRPRGNRNRLFVRKTKYKCALWAECRIIFLSKPGRYTRSYCAALKEWIKWWSEHVFLFCVGRNWTEVVLGNVRYCNAVKVLMESARVQTASVFTQQHPLFIALTSDVSTTRFRICSN